LIFAIGFAFIPASWVATIVRERETKVKHQMLISGALPLGHRAQNARPPGCSTVPERGMRRRGAGVSTLAYWTSSYAWDVCNFIVPGGLAFAIPYIYDITPLTGV
jgi:hypothetical protein